MALTTEFSFSVDSALLGELGEKLVSTVHVALAELIKNAYDADLNGSPGLDPPAKESSTTGHRKGYNGLGMNLGDVRTFWMKIGR